MLSFIMLSVIILSVILKSVIMLSHYVIMVECHHADCHYAECQYPKCHPKCHSAECRHTECRGALVKVGNGNGLKKSSFGTGFKKTQVDTNKQTKLQNNFETKKVSTSLDSEMSKGTYQNILTFLGSVRFMPYLKLTYPGVCTTKLFKAVIYGFS